ncbi:MAG: membrane protein insertion efficiency factor YidD [Epsilonproteobacteria bacterium]|nr:membrane protein insertion efficiency factor YidD [Campylobacterota bacterium]
MVRKTLLFILKIYQKVFTLLSYGSCRYYPTCSEYAKWKIEQDESILSFFAIFWRIARCNQLFKGGVDYPVVVKKNLRPQLTKKIEVVYWLIPKGNSRYILIKNFKGLKC